MKRRRLIPAAIAAVAVLIALAVPALSATSGTPGTVYACVSSSHTLTHVSVASPLACPSQRPVSWPASVNTPPPSPSPSPTPTPTGTPTPTPTPTGGPCVVSGAMDGCGPYTYAPNTASNGYNTLLSNDVWNQPAGFTGQTCDTGSPSPCQTMTATDPGNWSVTANYPDGNTAVLAY